MISRLLFFIYLVPVISFSQGILLDEVVIHKHKPKKKIIGYVNKRKKLFWHIYPKTELTTLIKYTKVLNDAYVRKVIVPIRISINRKVATNKWKRYYPTFRSIIRLYLYKNDGGKPGNRLLDEPILIECDQKSDTEIEFNLENEFIVYPKEGIFVAVEMIKTRVDNTHESLPAFSFTDKKNKDIFSVSYIKTVYSEDWKELDVYNKNLKSNSDYNMAISIVLDVYKKN